MSVLNQFRIENRVALVTGAGRGIGLAIARAFAEAGAAVAIQDLDVAVAEEAARSIADAGGRAVAFGGDARTIADVESWPTIVRERLGAAPDILVNNVSIQATMKPEEWAVDRIEEILRTNVTGPFRLCQLVAPAMRERRWGRILNVGSIQGLKGNASMTPYAASKAALHNLTEGFARELGAFGITVNALAPGVIVGTQRNAAFAERTRADDFKWLPLRRPGRPEDVAPAALFLCSDAGAYVTGSIVSIDGGMRVN